LRGRPEGARRAGRDRFPEEIEAASHGRLPSVRGLPEDEGTGRKVSAGRGDEEKVRGGGRALKCKAEGGRTNLRFLPTSACSEKLVIQGETAVPHISTRSASERVLAASGCRTARRGRRRPWWRRCPCR